MRIPSDPFAAQNGKRHGMMTHVTKWDSGKAIFIMKDLTVSSVQLFDNNPFRLEMKKKLVRKIQSQTIPLWNAK